MHCKNLNVKVNKIGEGKAKQKKLIFKKGEFIMRKRFSRTAALVLAGVIAAGALTGCGNDTLTMATGGTSGTYYGYCGIIVQMRGHLRQQLLR